MATNVWSLGLVRNDYIPYLPLDTVGMSSLIRGQVCILSIGRCSEPRLYNFVTYWNIQLLVKLKV